MLPGVMAAWSRALAWLNVTKQGTPSEGLNEHRGTGGSDEDTLPSPHRTGSEQLHPRASFLSQTSCFPQDGSQAPGPMVEKERK